MLAVSKSGLALLWRYEVGLFKTYQGQTMRIGHPGISDLIGITRWGQFIACEVKTGSGKLRESQIAFSKIVKKMNGLFIEARSVEQVLLELSRAESAK